MASKKNNSGKSKTKQVEGVIGKNEARFAHETSRLKKEIAEKDSALMALNNEKEKERLSKENAELRLEQFKKENNPLVIINDQDAYEKDVERLFFSKELDAQMINQIKNSKIEIIQAETDARIRLIEAEKNSPEAIREQLKLEERIKINKLLIIIGGALTLVGCGLLFLSQYLFGGFIGALGLAVLAIGIAHFNSTEDIDTAKKILDLFPKFPRLGKGD